MMLRTSLIWATVVLATAACSEDGVVISDTTGGNGGTASGGAAAGGGTGAVGGSGAGGDAGGGVGGGLGGGGAGGAGVPRLLVAADDGSGHGLFVWEDPDALTTDAAPDVVVQDGAADQARSVVVSPAGVFVATAQTSAALVAFGDPASLGASSSPSAVIPRSALPGAGAPPDRVVHGGGPSDVLLLSSFLDGAYLFNGASSLTNGSTPAAHFTHGFQQLPSVALDAASGRLLSGQISGAGLLAWDDAPGASGSPTHDHVVSDDAVWDLAMAGSRTYGAGQLNGQAGLGVWSTSALGAPAAPLFTLGISEGVDSFVEDLEVDHDVLVVCVQGGAGSGPRVLLWDGAEALAAPAPPDAVIHFRSTPRRAELSSAGILYVLSDAGITLYATPTTTPTLITTLTGNGTLSGYEDLAIAE